MSAYICIATLSKSSIPFEDIKKFLYTIEIKSIKQYLQLAKVCTGTNRNKNRFIEMLIYGHTSNNMYDIESIEQYDSNPIDELVTNKKTDSKYMRGYGNCDRNRKAIIKNNELNKS